jgi:glyoxylase-like metal-dependent hydrolase (beta-lactamase superfamily II)
MKLWKTERKNEIFQVLSGRNNCFLIPSEKGNMLIDTGLEFAYSSLRKDIEHLHLATGKIDYLILTHTHFDHCRNARAIQAEYGSQIVVGKRKLILWKRAIHLSQKELLPLLSSWCI